MTRSTQPIGSGDAAGGQNVNALVRSRAKGWPMDVGSGSPRPGASTGINTMSAGGSQPTVRQPDASALQYEAYATSPAQHHIVHQGSVIGYATQYQHPGAGPLWQATLADHVHALDPDRRKTTPGFVHASDAAQHVMDSHRDVAQIENVGSWRPAIGGGPNVPGH
jgi:hypothetical protein